MLGRIWPSTSNQAPFPCAARTATQRHTPPPLARDASPTSQPQVAVALGLTALQICLHFPD
jgi:hypothetical protein